jgi:hypothetical protein
MESRYYEARGIDLERLASELERTLMMQGDTVQHFGNNDQMTVQVKKGSDFAAFFGMQSALTLTMQRSPGGVLAIIGQQKWVDKAAVGVVGMLVLWPLAFTAGAGAIQQPQLGSQVMRSLDMLVRQQIPVVRIGPLPPGMIPEGPQYLQPGAPPPQQQAWSPKPPGANTVTCANCHTENNEGAIYCMNCGRPMATPQTQKIPCPACGAETKPNAAFCTQCGSSLTQPQSGVET